jgi:hypothetical protein
MLSFMDSIRGTRFTARIIVGTRSQDKANVLSILKDSDRNAMFKTVSGRLNNAYKVEYEDPQGQLGIWYRPLPAAASAGVLSLNLRQIIAAHIRICSYCTCITTSNFLHCAGRFIQRPITTGTCSF